MIRNKVVATLLLSLIIVVVITRAQTSQDACPSGTPKCYKDLVPYAGHNLSASQLPPNLCPAGCAGDNRRVIVIRIDQSWGTTTNTNVWDAVQCAAAAWNNASDGASPPNKIGYYLVLDQANLTNVADADITIFKQTPNEGLAACDVGINNENANRHNVIKLDPVNGDLGVGGGLNFQASDLCGRVAHELGHVLGIGEASNCRSIMFGANLNGSRDVDTVQSTDVAQVNQNFNSVTRDNCQTTTPAGNVAAEPILTPTPTPTPCLGNGLACSWDGDCCSNSCSQWTYTCKDPDDGGCTPQTCPGQCFEGYCTQTPIVIDVSGDGFSLTNLSNGVAFDLDVDGRKELIAWTSGNSDDGWLALDRNRNGAIDDGSELFGEFTPQAEPHDGERKNGFLALAEFDKAVNSGNNDGIISSADAVFSFLRLWQDTNHNGVSEVQELRSLSSVDLISIDLAYKTSQRVDENGNWFRYRAKVRDSKASRLNRWAWDVRLIRAP
ncbi:MAG: hypothetical protein V7638_885 [Acidobacteriota bacterium]|jgi:hypothetical protein